MKKEIVKYENRLNDYSLSGFNAVDLNLFMLICSKVKDSQSELLSFPFVELKKAVGQTRKTDKEFLKHLNQMAAKVKRINGNYKKDDSQFFEFNLFSDFYGTTVEVTAENEKTAEAYSIYGPVLENTLLVSVNPRYAFLLNEMESYTKFDLCDFVKLESKYSKNLFRLLRQFRRTGKYKVAAERFRELMGCPKSYPNKEFMRICVNPAVKELSQGYFDNLTVKPIRAAKRGAPIVAYEFTFRKSDQVPGQMNIEDIDADPAQEKPKKPRMKKNHFNNFEQRQYDFDALESDLLNATVTRNKESDDNQKGEEHAETDKSSAGGADQGSQEMV